MSSVARSRIYRPATPMPPLRSRTVLGDLGNCFASGKQLADTPAPWKRASGEMRKAAGKEQQAPPSTLEPPQLEPQSATSVQMFTYNVSEELLLEVVGKHEDDDGPNFCNSYRNLRDIEEIKVKYACRSNCKISNLE